MPRNCQGSKSSQIASVFERKETERYQDKKDGLLVDVPAKQEGCKATECKCSHKHLPVGLQPQLGQCSDLKSQSQSKAVLFRQLRQSGKVGVADKASRDTVDCCLVELDVESWSNCDQDPICEGVKSPEVGRPVSVTETTRKGEQSSSDLLELTHGCKWAESRSKHYCYAGAQLGCISKLRSEDGFRGQAICAEQEDEIRWREVQVDVLETEQQGEKYAAVQQCRLFPRNYN